MVWAKVNDPTERVEGEGLTWEDWAETAGSCDSVRSVGGDISKGRGGGK